MAIRWQLALLTLTLSTPALAQDRSASAPAEVEEVDPLSVDGGVFKPSKGLQFVSADGNFSLTTRLRAQFLYTALNDPEEEDVLHSFQIRRARVVFGGNVFGKHNKYKTELAFSPRDEAVDDGPKITPLLDWYGEFDHVKDLTLRVGQYKVPFSRQRVISSGDLQLVDRSITQSEFNLDRDVGLHVFSPNLAKLDLFRYYAGVWINQGRDAHEAEPLHPMVIARVEVLPLGMFDDYTEADLDRSEDPGLSLGMAYAHLDDATKQRGILGDPWLDGGTADVHVATADLMFKWQGVSVFGEGYFRDQDRSGGDLVDETGAPIPLEPARDGIGWFAQAGYVLPPAPVEIAARYSTIEPSGDEGSLSVAHEVGGGVSYYPGEHSLKVQADYFRLWGEDGLSEGADQVRVQMQLAY